MRRVPIVDLVAVLAVAVVLLLPKASITAQPALVGDAIELDRVAELEDQRYRQPDDVEAAIKLADSFLSFFRSDWALATLAQFSSGHDYRVHLLLATAHAERLEAAQVVSECALVEKYCAEAGPKCLPGTLAKNDLISSSMKVLVEKNIDPAKDPVRARQAVAEVLHSAHPRFSGKVTPPAPSPKK
jgi:hypothetical protein